MRQDSRSSSALMDNQTVEILHALKALLESEIPMHFSLPYPIFHSSTVSRVLSLFNQAAQFPRSKIWPQLFPIDGLRRFFLALISVKTRVLRFDHSVLETTKKSFRRIDFLTCSAVAHQNCLCDSETSENAFFKKSLSKIFFFDFLRRFFRNLKNTLSLCEALLDVSDFFLFWPQKGKSKLEISLGPFSPFQVSHKS